uniref:Transmembrane protein 65 n=1 Tax=Timema douglasi TaxID=61478 RepID=A0A7R8VD32_TIMDO|nr:unnamed protein product [Timema douglasi]
MEDEHEEELDVRRGIGDILLATFSLSLQEFVDAVCHQVVASQGDYIEYSIGTVVVISTGDYIEYSIGTVVVISTMAAAALGNTISDILGLGSAWYVERMAIRVGMKPPKLSPIQLDMPISRRFANLGRVLGVTIGCLLGMLPLLFLSKKLSNEEPHEDEE